MVSVAHTHRAGHPARAEALVETGWLAATLTRPDVRLIDVSGTRKGYERGHLAGAVYASARTDLVDPTHPVRGMAPTREQFQAVMRRLGVKTTDAVVLYDDSNDGAAARAFWILKLYRHERVAILNGGNRKWVAEARPLVTEVPVVMPSAYVAADRDATIDATAAYTQARLGQVFLLDSRSPREYAGLDVQARGGHIPGAVNVEWTLAMRPDGTFKTTEELQRVYSRAGATREQEIVCYCQTGVRSAHTWFALRYLLNYPYVRNCDASWEEWGNRADLPIGR